MGKEKGYIQEKDKNIKVNHQYYNVEVSWFYDQNSGNVHEEFVIFFWSEKYNQSH